MAVRGCILNEVFVGVAVAAGCSLFVSRFEKKETIPNWRLKFPKCKCEAGHFVYHTYQAFVEGNINVDFRQLSSI